jgi:hypothetical protein
MNRTSRVPGSGQFRDRASLEPYGPRLSVMTTRDPIRGNAVPRLASKQSDEGATVSTMTMASARFARLHRCQAE